MIISDAVRVARKDEPKPKLKSDRLERLHRLPSWEQLEIQVERTAKRIQELYDRKGIPLEDALEQPPGENHLSTIQSE